MRLNVRLDKNGNVARRRIFYRFGGVWISDDPERDLRGDGFELFGSFFTLLCSFALGWAFFGWRMLQGKADFWVLAVAFLAILFPFALYVDARLSGWRRMLLHLAVGAAIGAAVALYFRPAL